MSFLKKIFSKRKKDTAPDGWAAIEWRVSKAIRVNDKDRLSFLFEIGASPNMILNKRDLQRPLHYAAWDGSIEIIDFLIASGADPLAGIQLHPYCKMLPSGFAEMMGNEENAAYLKEIENKCKQAIRDQGGCPPDFDEEFVPFRCLLSARKKSQKRPLRP